jgi:hypothetical protein
MEFKGSVEPKVSFMHFVVCVTLSALSHIESPILNNKPHSVFHFKL